MEEYYYSGSGFYEEGDTDIGDSFSEVTEVPSCSPDWVKWRARRYGQWWLLTGVNPSADNRGGLLEELRRRYAIVVTLHHPAVTRMVAMREVDVSGGECVIEEYADGLTLEKFMLTSPEASICRDLADQLIDALEYCHAKGVAHGNLTPQTVIVQRKTLNLMDFACVDDPGTDIRALAPILKSLGLKGTKLIAERCRVGYYKQVSDIRRDLTRRRQIRRWALPMALLTAVLATMMISFGLGHWWHRASLTQQTDSLPLPSIYFSDTVNLHLNGATQIYFSTITQANLFYLDYTAGTPGSIDEGVAVDLGLSVKWAPFNVGCSDYDVNHLGGFYTWCDTVGYGVFAPPEKYWPLSKPLTDISGTNLDAVRRMWGGRWRMPTQDELIELHDQCMWSLVYKKGLPLGYTVRGLNGNSIFLPLSGFRIKFENLKIGLEGHYWSSTPVNDHSRLVYAASLDTAHVYCSDSVEIGVAFSIRPVLDP